MNSYDAAAAALLPQLCERLIRVGDDVKRATFEFRLRAGKPVVLFGAFGSRVLLSDGTLGETPSPRAVTVSPQELQACFQRLCAYSIHSFQSEIVSGFVTLKGGHRAGLCGTAVLDATGRLTSVREVSSLNLRIAREVRDCARPLLKLLPASGTGGLLIAGPPASGKTTLLRDLVRLLSLGEGGRVFKVCVTDERGELAAVRDCVAQHDLGWNCDVLSGYPKAAAVEIALRTLSPEILVCDELMRGDELAAVKSGMNAGVRFFASVHAADKQDLLTRRVTAELLKTGAFSSVVLLESSGAPCRVRAIFDAKELQDELGACRRGLVF